MHSLLCCIAIVKYSQLEILCNKLCKNILLYIMQSALQYYSHVYTYVCISI